MLDGVGERGSAREAFEGDVATEVDKLRRAEFRVGLGHVRHREGVDTGDVGGVPDSEGGYDRGEVVVVLPCCVSFENGSFKYWDGLTVKLIRRGGGVNVALVAMTLGPVTKRSEMALSQP